MQSKFRWPEGKIESSKDNIGFYGGEVWAEPYLDTYVLLSNNNFYDSSDMRRDREFKFSINEVQYVAFCNVTTYRGECSLRVDYLQVGSWDTEINLSSVAIHFYEHSIFQPEGSRSKRTILPGRDGCEDVYYSVEESTPVLSVDGFGARLGEFRPHIVLLQDVVTFGKQSSAGITKLVGKIGGTSAEVEYYGYWRFGVSEREKQNRRISKVFSLNSGYSSKLISEWWSYTDVLRPIPQIIAGLFYRPVWIESSMLLMTAALERLINEMTIETPIRSDQSNRDEIIEYLNEFPQKEDSAKQIINDIISRMSTPSPKMLLEGLLSIVGGSIIIKNSEEWLRDYLKIRNGIAHGEDKIIGGTSLWLSPKLRETHKQTYILLAYVWLSFFLKLPKQILNKSPKVLKSTAERELQ